MVWKQVQCIRKLSEPEQRVGSAWIRALPARTSKTQCSESNENNKMCSRRFSMQMFDLAKPNTKNTVWIHHNVYPESTNPMNSYS